MRPPRILRRIPAGFRYFRAHGAAATWRRIFPRTRTYRDWVERYDTLSPVDIIAIREHVARLPRRPLFSLLLPVIDGSDASIAASISSAVEQLYPDFELCVGLGGSTSKAAALVHQFVSGHNRIKIAPSTTDAELATVLNACLAMAKGDFVAVLEPGDGLAPHALYLLAVEINRFADADIVFGDEDEFEHGTRIRTKPAFKSDWNPDLFLGCDAIGRLAAYRRSAVERAGGFRAGFSRAAEYELALRLTEQSSADRIRHIPMILYHRRAGDKSGSLGIEAAIADHIARSGRDATAERTAAGVVRMRYALPVPLPGVSLIIPTRDRVDLLHRCVTGLVARTNYSPIEIVIIDNASKAPETFEYFQNLQKQNTAKIIRFDAPFNYSAINNFGTSFTKYDILGFLNNDTDVITSDWLNEMVMHAIRPEIGAVGAKLFYPNNKIQHAGTVVGLGGLAGHAFRHFDRFASGYLDRLEYVHNVSAVTGACMVVRKDVFAAVGGFDAVEFPVAYNDVDFCLRVQARGYRNLWTPFAQLYHYESASRPSDYSPQRRDLYKIESDNLKARWQPVIRHDPYYNPNLTVEAENFSLAFPPRVTRPWTVPAIDS